MPDYPFKNLIFEGGGVKGIAYVDDKAKEALVQSGRENTLTYFKWYDDPKNEVVNRPGE